MHLPPAAGCLAASLVGSFKAAQQQQQRAAAALLTLKFLPKIIPVLLKTNLHGSTASSASLQSHWRTVPRRLSGCAAKAQVPARNHHTNKI
jgi:ABC-type transport system involved in cytochrome c biogenesis permease component